MPWIKTGDNAAMFPRLLDVAVLDGAEDHTLNEVAGFTHRLFQESAGHLTDRIVSLGMIQAIGGPRWRTVLDQAERVQLIRQVTVEGRKAYELIDEDEFVHIKLKAEVLLERGRRKHVRDPVLKARMLLRDGDACRYCGTITQWKDGRSSRGMTMDERRCPAEDEFTFHDVVVACKHCNSARGTKHRDIEEWDHQLAAADREIPLLSAPVSPFYSPRTAEWIERWLPGVQVTPATPRPQPVAETPAPGHDREDPHSAADSLDVASVLGGQQDPDPGHPDPDPPRAADRTGTASVLGGQYHPAPGHPVLPPASAPVMEQDGVRGADQPDRPPPRGDPVTTPSVRGSPLPEAEPAIPGQPRTPEPEPDQNQTTTKFRFGSGPKYARPGSTGRDGSGRDGSGKEGSGRDGLPPPAHRPGRKRR